MAPSSEVTHRKKKAAAAESSSQQHQEQHESMNTRGRNSFAAYQQLYQRQAALGLQRTVASINNKTKTRVIAFLVITVIYTTFLYCSGMILYDPFSSFLFCYKEMMNV